MKRALKEDDQLSFGVDSRQLRQHCFQDGHGGLARYKARISVYTVSSDHFFINHQPKEVADIVNQQLA